MKKYLHSTHRNILWFVKANRADELVINPPYQRNPVWTTAQKSYLIDTILTQYPIPELYMQSIVGDDGNAVETIVDGQQRIRACLEFVNNEFSLASGESQKYGGMTFDDLSGELKKRIYEYDFVVRILPDMPDTEIRQIFKRLNRNTVALNDQELRHATYWGGFITTANEISNYEQWIDLGVFTANDVRRMLDVEYISEIMIAVLHGYQNKKKTIDKYYRFYEEEFESSRELKDRFNKTILEIEAILPSLKKTRFRKKSDFYSLFVELYKYSNIFPIDGDNRIELHKQLIEFAHNVDDFSRYDEDTVDNPKQFPAEIRKYGSGLLAATDISSRKRRGDVLGGIISSILKSEEE